MGSQFVETLETRRLLAQIGVDVIDDLLHITGTPGGDGVRIALHSKRSDHLSIAANKRVSVVPLKGVRGITIDVGDGDDHVAIDSSFGTIPLARTVVLGKGHDLYEAGAGRDKVSGGKGNDTLFTGSGNDYLEAGSGVNLLAAGAGDDVILGGYDVDHIFAAAGNDFATGGSGDDHLDGGIGNDYLLGNFGQDTIQGMGGHDTLSAGDGNGIHSEEFMSRGHAVRDDEAREQGLVLRTFDQSLYALGSSDGRLLADAAKQPTEPEPPTYGGGGSGGVISFNPFGDVLGYEDGEPGPIKDVLSGGNGNDVMLGGERTRMTGGRGRDTFGADSHASAWMDDDDVYRNTRHPYPGDDPHLVRDEYGRLVPAPGVPADYRDWPVSPDRYDYQLSTRYRYYMTDLGAEDRVPYDESGIANPSARLPKIDASVEFVVAGHAFDLTLRDVDRHLRHDNARLGDVFDYSGLVVNPRQLDQFIAGPDDRVRITVDGVETDDWMEHRVGHGDSIVIEFIPAGFEPSV